MWHDVASLGEVKEDASATQICKHKTKVFHMRAFAAARLKSDLKAEYNQGLTKLTADDFNAILESWDTDINHHKTKFYFTINSSNYHMPQVRKFIPL